MNAVLAMPVGIRTRPPSGKWLPVSKAGPVRSCCDPPGAVEFTPQTAGWEHESRSPGLPGQGRSSGAEQARLLLAVRIREDPLLTNRGLLPLGRGRGQRRGPRRQAETVEDRADRLRRVDRGEDPHPAVACRTLQNVDPPDAPHQLRPGAVPRARGVADDGKRRGLSSRRRLVQVAVPSQPTSPKRPTSSSSAPTESARR